MVGRRKDCYLPRPARLHACTTGEVSERFKVPDSKSGVAKVTVGSNPTLSATSDSITQHENLTQH